MFFKIEMISNEKIALALNGAGQVLYSLIADDLEDPFNADDFTPIMINAFIAAYAIEACVKATRQEVRNREEQSLVRQFLPIKKALGLDTDVRLGIMQEHTNFAKRTFADLAYNNATNRLEPEQVSEKLISFLQHCFLAYKDVVLGTDERIIPATNLAHRGR